MASYQSTNCGACGASWQNMSVEHDTNIGPPLIKCRQCNTLNKTKMYLYRDANWFGKLYYWVSTSFSTLLFGGGAIFGGIALVRSDIGTIAIIIGVLITGFGLYLFKRLFDSPKYFKILEETFDNNGGFLWSDETY